MYKIHIITSCELVVHTNLTYYTPNKFLYGEVKFIQDLQSNKLLDSSKFISNLVAVKQLQLRARRFTDFF